MGPVVVPPAPPRAGQGFACRPLSDPSIARGLFEYVALPFPDLERVVLAWGAWMTGPAGERLVGAVLGEGADRAALLHGPVVDATLTTSGGEGVDPLEVAVQLVLAVLDHAGSANVETVYARPQGLDRVWVRHGFIPLPEVALPSGLRGRPGAGLYAWRGGSALWAMRGPDRH